ncbi:MAG: hypothetical protein AAF146_02720, partial [Bacteroidota bacterium]
MKKVFLIGWMLLMAGSVGWAQDGDLENNPRIQEMREEFFNRELQLSPQEAKAFWPLYNDLRSKERELKAKLRDGRRLELMTDAEAERYLEEYLDVEEQQLALKREYFGKFKQVINIRKIAMLN